MRTDKDGYTHRGRDGEPVWWALALAFIAMAVDVFLDGGCC